jgi:pimeloyl-ACP methyl ester carboxylesterase
LEDTGFNNRDERPDGNEMRNAGCLKKWRRSGIVLTGGLALAIAGCAAPIQVHRVDTREVERQLDRNVISTGELSEATRIVLHQRNLAERFGSDPDGAIAQLHRTIADSSFEPGVFYALAEMSFLRAAETGQHQSVLAAAVYAYAFLFPDDAKQRPGVFDPRSRTACDIYNRSLTRAFASADRSLLELRSGRFALPFGGIDVSFDPAAARWGDQLLSNFSPADELAISGLDIRYRRPGLGASLAADATPSVQKVGLQVDPELKVPVTALLRVETSRRALTGGWLRGRIEIYPAFEPNEVKIAGQSVPLEADTSTAFAFGLSNPKVWQSELSGFFNGNFFDRAGSQLLGLEPYRRGQIPVVFIHGTGSSAGRWANLINDLQSDPVIREGFQFWTFSYASGNPTSFTAERLREAIEGAVSKLDPQGTDSALQDIVLIGHSQGGLIAKWQTIDSGSRLWDALSTKPPEAMRVSPDTARLLRRVFFLKPVPQVRRVIFIATPQHGSFVADSPIGEVLTRFLTPAAPIMDALRDLTEDNAAELRGHPEQAPSGSVWSMDPDNPLLKAFSAIPVSPKVAAHSIIAVRGNGAVETGDDGVVSYQSAHIPEAKSELVVRSGHSVQSDPRTVSEVRRILLLHLRESCPVSCLPITVSGSQAAVYGMPHTTMYETNSQTASAR